MNQGDYCTHAHHRGVILVYLGQEFEDYLPDPPEHDCDEDEGCWTCEAWGQDNEDWDQRPTGQVWVRMVGDDKKFLLDPEGLTLYEDHACSCGQVGCPWF